MRKPLRIALVLCLVGVPALAQYVPPIPPPIPTAPTVEAEQRVAAAGDSVEAGEARLSSIRAELGDLDGQVTNRVRALYRLQRAGILPVAGGFDAMLEHLARLQRLERMVVRDVSRKRSLRAEARQVEQSLSAAREEADAAEEALASAQRALPPDHGLNTFFDPNYTPRLAVVPVPQYGLTLRGRPERNFQQLRGNLPMPIVGGGNITDASREDGSGLEFSAAPGRGVRSVAEGTVAFARRYGVYGTMVVVDHGQSFFTVYAGLAQLEVSVGQAVHPEQRLGVTEGPLYFEVRRGTRSLDPRSWIGL